jgi:hypothetical protein
MRIRITQHVRREPDATAPGGFRESDATPPFVEVASGEYRGRFDRGREYDVTSTEGRIVMSTGFFEEVGPREGEAFPTDEEITAGRQRRDAGAAGSSPAAADTTTAPGPGTATTQQHEITDDAPGVPVTPLSASPGDLEAIREHEGVSSTEAHPNPDRGEVK